MFFTILIDKKGVKKIMAPDKNMGYIMQVIKKLEKNGIFLDHVELVRLCKKYKVRELSIFGSSIRDDFREESDIDFLVSYLDEWENTLLDMVRLKDELSVMVNRKTDLIEKEALQNPVRKKIILSTAEVIYAYN